MLALIENIKETNIETCELAPEVLGESLIFFQTA